MHLHPMYTRVVGLTLPDDLQEFVLPHAHLPRAHPARSDQLHPGFYLHTGGRYENECKDSETIFLPVLCGSARFSHKLIVDCGFGMSSVTQRHRKIRS